MDRVILGVGLVALVVCLVGEGTDRFVLRAMGKTIASLAFVALAFDLGVPVRSPHGAAFLAAFVLSVAGDLLLLGNSKRALLAGIAAFLAAHVGFTVGFVSLGVSAAGAAVTAVPVLLFGAGVASVLVPKAGKLSRAVVAYIVVISAMVIAAGGVAATEAPGTRLALVAAVLFFVSDLFVARQRFVTTSPWNRYLGLPLYYVAQVLFAYAGATLGTAA